MFRPITPFQMLLTVAVTVTICFFLGRQFQLFCYPKESVYHNANPLWCK